MIKSCGGNCFRVNPPPDNILSMPPPPLPSFVLPKTALMNLITNDSYPCFATFMCDSNPHPPEVGMEFVEVMGNNNSGMANTWLFVLSLFCVGVLILGGLLAVILLKCREALFSSCNFSYHDANIKQGGISGLNEPTKANPFMVGGILYPCNSVRNEMLQNQFATDNRLLWATLTPHGTRHFISSYPAVNQDGGYEIVDYRFRTETTLRDCSKPTPVKSFDNNGFVDYDYEDPTPLMDSNLDDLDSGYQELQEIVGALQCGSPRPFVSSPTKIENPNIPPLNGNSIRYGVLQSNTMNLNHKTLNYRISDASS